jgi:glycosyltransferase involved in cell wall biosynthesis
MTSVSVIVPTRNRLELLQRALESVRYQTHQATEVLVVDDASSDGTPDWLANSPYIHLHSEVRVGAAGARNLALREAQGEIIAFLDDDDQWAPDYLARQAQSLEDSDLSYVAHQNSGRKVDDRLLFSYPDPVVGYLCESYLHTMSVVACRRTLFNKVGFLNSNWQVSHDYEWFARMLLSGARMARVPESLVTRHSQADSLVANHRLWFQEEDNIIEELLAEFHHLRPFRGRIMAHRAIFASWLSFRRGDYPFAQARLQRAAQNSWLWTSRIVCARIWRNLWKLLR